MPTARSWQLLRFGLNILVSDADIAWVRSPLPYFKAVRRRHPAVDFLLCTDKAHNNLQSKPLFAPTERHGSSRQGGGRRLGALEHRNRSSWAGVGRNRSSLAGVGRLRAMYGDLIGTQRAEGGEGRGRPKRANATGELSPTSGDLDLEHGVHSAIPSYNIGILMLYAHANASLAAMIGDLWTAVSAHTHTRTLHMPYHTRKPEPDPRCACA